MRTDDEIKAMIKRAARPVKCVVSFEDSGATIRIRLQIPGKRYKDQMAYTKNDEWTDSELENALYVLRVKLQETDIEVDPWEFPSPKQ